MFRSSANTSPFANDDASLGPFFDAGHRPPPSLLSSSLPSSYFLHRSSSYHSLQTPTGFQDPGDFHGFLPDPVRRVFSAEDLQCMNGPVASGDASLPDVAGRIGRYSAEERRERIERYRSKRNQRNFHKKITYACRKTLADSRPRVRGRFARNGEAEHEIESADGGFAGWNPYSQAVDMGGGGAGGGGGDWWRKMQATLEIADEDEGGYEEDLWASFDSVFAVNLSSGLS